LAKDTDHLAGSFETENTGGVLSGFLAEENEFDRRALWRIGSWGVGAIGAVILAVMANQSSLGWRRDQIAAADLTRQAQQLQTVARESQSEARRLASAIDTLNGDRDRLYSRVTLLEQGLDSVTGAIARQNTAAASPPAAQSPAATTQPMQAQAPAVMAVATTPAAAAAPEKPAAVEKPPAPAASEAGSAAVSSHSQDIRKPPAATPATPLVAAKSMMAPPDPAASKLIEPSKPASPIVATAIPEVMASTQAAGDAETDEITAPKAAIQRTEFGVDLGSANSLGGLRALWRGLLKSRSNASLTALRPIIVVKESTTGLGMQLRLVAGPLSDAAAAARICAVLAENDRACETAIFDGQRLGMQANDALPASSRPPPRKRGMSKRAAVDEPARKPDVSTLSSLFGLKGQ
jgi:hypothetical protein